MNTEIIKGFRDYVGEDAEKRAEVRKLLVETFEKYGFEPAETPMIENEEFVRGENEKDEAVSDIFKLQDKGKRKLALRYEFTFQLKRLMANKKIPYKRYQIGEVFRDEPVSSNRFRQFVQCDADIVGSKIKDEAEILSMAKEVLEKIGVKYTIYLNNRKLLNEILEKEGVKNKEQVIKEIDKLDKISEKEVRENLEKYNAGKVFSVFKKPKDYFKKYDSFKEIEELEKYLKYYGIKIEFSPSLARGLSYYNGTIFEIKTNEMRETITSGGSYMFNGIQCSGISFGLDRISSLAKIETEKEKYLIVSLDEDKEAILITKKLRNKNKIAQIYYGKPTKALEYANSYKINKVIFVGEKEVKGKKFKVKDMKSGKETALKI